MALTVKAIEGFKPKEKAYKVSDGGGMYLLVQPAKRVDGKLRAAASSGRWVTASAASSGP